MRSLAWLGVVGLLVSCGPVSPEIAAQRCEDRARATQGPEGGVTVGLNSNTGSFANARIGVSLDALRGTDPQAVYEACVLRMTDEVPIRPPMLRNR